MNDLEMAIDLGIVYPPHPVWVSCGCGIDYHMGPDTGVNCSDCGTVWVWDMQDGPVLVAAQGEPQV